MGKILTIFNTRNMFHHPTTEELTQLELDHNFKELVKEYWYIYSRPKFNHYIRNTEVEISNNYNVVLNIIYLKLIEIDELKANQEVYLISLM